MKTQLLSFPGLILCLLVVFSGCGKKNDVPQQQSKQLSITLLDQYTTPPAKVSAFFKVNHVNGTPIGGLDSSHFSIFEKGRNDESYHEISKFEATRRISPRGQLFKHATLLVLDLSGSVTNQSLEELKVASKAFIDNIMPTKPDSSYIMEIAWFDGSDNLFTLVPATDKVKTLKSGIDGIHANMSVDNSTDLYGAILKIDSVAHKTILRYEKLNIINAVSIVIFTDGRDQAGRYSKQAAFNAVDSMHEDITLFTIGLGGEIDRDVLSRIGTSGSAFADNSGELERIFNEIALLVWNEANSYYLFEYCTPKRDGSGVNELRLDVNVLNETGCEETNFDASGFTGGCSL